MKKFLLLFLLSLGFLVGCSNESVVTEKTTESGARLDGCDAQVFDINAGQHILSGNVSVQNDFVNLYVTYNANSDWRFKELHLFVGPYANVPTRNGNPVPGRFPYKVNFNQLTSTYTFTIPFTAIAVDQNGCYVVAAHSSMRKVNGNGGVIQSETGWGGYNDFPGNNWARYFNYCKCIGVVQ